MWRYIAARATGTSHQKLDQPCQDRFACGLARPGWFVAAVSDGAGSAAYAEIGAEIAVTVARDVCINGLADDAEPLHLVREASRAAHDAIRRHAAEAGSTPRDFAATLLLVILGPEGGAAAQIGDGLIAVKADEEGWSWVFWPQRGEYANVTQFITDEDALDALQCDQLLPDVLEVGLMTDGLEPLALHYAQRAVHDRFFEGMMPAIRSSTADGEIAELSAALRAFLGSPRVTERADDDLTLVLAARR